MEFTITRELLVKPLQRVVGAVEKRQTMAILGNVLLQVKSHQLCITATDLEIELVARVTLTEPAVAGEITLPAKKFIDICKNLPEHAIIHVTIEDEQALIRAGRSRFTLTTMPAAEFPVIDEKAGDFEFLISEKQLRYLLESTLFSMATNDVRYYLNGLLLEIGSGAITSVATDGHRLAVCKIPNAKGSGERQVIIPRKGVQELNRMLNDSDDMVTVTITASHIRIAADDYTFTSKLIDGRFPEYGRVIPRNADKHVLIDKEELRNALLRVSILSNEKYRGIKLSLSNGRLNIMANNPEQEEAEEELEIHYSEEDVNIGFNVSYILDVLNNTPVGDVRLSFSDSTSSLLIEPVSDEQRLYVVMPMRV